MIELDVHSVLRIYSTEMRHSESLGKRRNLLVLVWNDYEIGRGILRGVSHYALPSRGWTIHFRHPKPGQVEDFRKLDPVGVVAQVAHPDLADELTDWKGMPVVNVSNVRKENRFPQTGFDDVGIGRVAAEYFLNRGFRNFAFLGQAERENARQRQEGFAEVLAGRGHSVTARWLDRPSRLRAVVEWEGVGENTRNWLMRLPRPVALFCHNDIQAADALRLCAELGISVPEEMAILGVDSDPMFCCLNHPSLSSIAIRPEEVGFLAAARLDAIIAGKGAGGDQLVEPAGVEERQSTEVIAIEDEAVAAALRFIRERATAGIMVPEVVAASGTSRRMLERRFVNLLGRSPALEIRRVRLERARELLRTTGRSLEVIAEACGFSNAIRMTEAFRREFGLTPGRYRKEMRGGNV